MQLRLRLCVSVCLLLTVLRAVVEALPCPATDGYKCQPSCDDGLVPFDTLDCDNKALLCCGPPQDDLESNAAISSSENSARASSSGHHATYPPDDNKGNGKKKRDSTSKDKKKRDSTYPPAEGDKDVKRKSKGASTLDPLDLADKKKTKKEPRVDRVKRKSKRSSRSSPLSSPSDDVLPEQLPMHNGNDNAPLLPDQAEVQQVQEPLPEVEDPAVTKRRKKRADLVNRVREFVSTEKDYMNSLYLCRRIVDGLLIKLDHERNAEGFTADQINLLFSNMFDLYDLHLPFLESMSNVVEPLLADVDSASDLELVAPILTNLIKHAPQFVGPYGTNLGFVEFSQQVQEALDIKKDKSPEEPIRLRFRAELVDAIGVDKVKHKFQGEFSEEVEAAMNADNAVAELRKLLPKPFQRLMKYPLLLRDLHSAVVETEDSKRLFHTATARLEETIFVINSLLKDNVRKFIQFKIEGFLDSLKLSKHKGFKFWPNQPIMHMPWREILGVSRSRVYYGVTPENSVMEVTAGPAEDVCGVSSQQTPVRIVLSPKFIEILSANGAVSEILESEIQSVEMRPVKMSSGSKGKCRTLASADAETLTIVAIKDVPDPSPLLKIKETVMHFLVFGEQTLKLVHYTLDKYRQQSPADSSSEPIDNPKEEPVIDIEPIDHLKHLVSDFDLSDLQQLIHDDSEDIGPAAHQLALDLEAFLMQHPQSFSSSSHEGYHHVTHQDDEFPSTSSDIPLSENIVMKSDSKDKRRSEKNQPRDKKPSRKASRDKKREPKLPREKKREPKLPREKDPSSSTSTSTIPIRKSNSLPFPVRPQQDDFITDVDVDKESHSDDDTLPRTGHRKDSKSSKSAKRSVLRGSKSGSEDSESSSDDGF